MRRRRLKQFLWQPGVGIDAAALSRIQSHFTRPKYPMGEAWFMGKERRLFHELEGDLNSLTAEQLQQPLQEIAGGISAFGPHTEWNDWYLYLLGRLLPRSHEDFVSSLLESLVTCFMAVYPAGVHPSPYRGFEEDALLTLGRCMMEPECWNGSEIAIGNVLHRSNNNPNRVWCWWNASGDFSASLFFCLKYLPPSLIQAWFRSALEIPSPHWRAQVLVWLVGAHDAINAKTWWPSEFPDDARSDIGWEWSHCLRRELVSAAKFGSAAPFLPDVSRTQVLEVVRDYFTESVFLDWVTSLDRFPYLVAELAELPATFERLYVRSH